MAMSENLTAHPAEAEKPLARLCYVDDSRTAAFVMRRILEPHGYQIDYFQAAEPAVVALIKDDYDLLLTDLKVSSSGMDGDDLIRTLRQSGQTKLSQLPIIVITGSTDAEVLVKVYDAGANQVMTKPVDADALDGHIRRLLFERLEHEKIKQAERISEPSAPPPPAPRTTGNKAASSGDEKTIPLLEVANIPVAPVESSESVAQTTVQPLAEGRADNASTANTAQDERPSMIERAMRDNFKAAAPASEPTSATPSKPSFETKLSSAASPSMESKPTQALPVDKFENYEGEVEIIIDPERPANRKRRGSSDALQKEEEILHEVNQFALDGSQPPPRNPLRDYFSLRFFALTLLFIGLLFAGLKGWQFYFDKGYGVTTTIAETGEIYQSIVLPGHVVSQQQVAVNAAIDGRLVAISVMEGDMVEAGQLLAQLDNRELLSHLKRVQMNLANAREGISLADSILKRLRSAYEKGAVEKRFVEDAEVKLRAAKARAGVVAEDAHNASQEFERQRITAPFSGTITHRQAEIGQWVTPEDTLFLLADGTQREIELHVDTADSTGISVGQVALVTSDAFPDQEWQESVTRMGTAAEKQQDSNLVKIFVSLGEQAPRLRFGQQVDAEIRTAWSPNAIKVPFEALQVRDGQVFVAVLQDNEVRMKPVITGIEDFSSAEVRQGLRAGQEVILPRGHFLQDGDKVFSLDGDS